MDKKRLFILEKEIKEIKKYTESLLSEFRKDQLSGSKHNYAIKRQENKTPVFIGDVSHSSNNMPPMVFEAPPTPTFPHPPFTSFPPHPPLPLMLPSSPLLPHQNHAVQHSFVSTHGLELNSSSSKQMTESLSAKTLDVVNNTFASQKAELKEEDFTKFIKTFIPFLKVYYHCEEEVAYLYVLFQHLLLNIVQERYPQSNWAYKKEFDSNEFFILMLTHPEYLFNVQQTCSKTLNRFFKDNLELLNKFFHYVYASSSNAALVQNLKLIFTKKNIIIKPRFELAKATENSLRMSEKEDLLRKFKYHLKLIFDSLLIYMKGEIAHHSLLCVEEFVKNKQDVFSIVTTNLHNALSGSYIFKEYYHLMPDSYKNHIVTHAKIMVNEKEDIRAHKHSVKQQANPTSYNKKYVPLILEETFYDPVNAAESKKSMAVLVNTLAKRKSS